jgi:hypothetical protein
MRLESIEQFKDLIGKEIFAIPTGSNARGQKKNAVVKFYVSSVGRKYVKLCLLYWNGDKAGEDNYLPSSGATQWAANNGYVHNAGYKFFASMDDVESHNHDQRIRAGVSSFFRGWGAVSSLSDEDAKEIHTIISKYNKD